MATATGGSGQYIYHWYSNDEQINTNFTQSTYILNITSYGTYKVTCIVTDANGTSPDYAKAPEIYLNVVNGGPIAAAGAPSATASANQQNQDQNQNLTLILAAVVIAVAVIAITVVTVKKLRTPKPTQNSN